MGIELDIERMTPEGQGLGRPAKKGMVHFVPYTAPGDRIEATVTHASKGYMQARLSKLLQAGPARVDPPCKLHFRPGGPKDFCGGCNWQHLNRDMQLTAKREIVRDCLFRIAKLREPEVEATLPSPSGERYRNKVLVPVGRQGKQAVAGFFAPGSHRIVPFDDCLVQPELSVRIVRRITELASDLRWQIYDEKRGDGWLRHIFVRSNQDGQALLTLVTRTPGVPGQSKLRTIISREFPEIIGVHQNVQAKNTPVVLGPKWQRLWGAETLEERLGRVRLAVSPAAFLQINTPAAEKLYALAEEYLTQGNFRPDLALDLYSGVGSIALWIAKRCGRVVGLEENHRAVEDARHNAELNNISNTRFYAGRVEKQIARLDRELRAAKSAAAVLDPPRAGCDREVLKALKHPALKRIVYVSCNPATFARDADRLKRWKWRLQRVRPVDLFPQTAHVEVVGLFTR
jgi:23S rRNA (uracil1939-C5)-methyltransferase